MTRQERTLLALAAVQTFGAKRTTRQLVAMTGAPDDATVTFGTIGRQIEYHATGSTASMSGTLFRSMGDGKVVNRISWVGASRQDSRTGTSIHGRMVEHGAIHGVERLSLDAVRSQTYVGYAVWPTLGYNAPLRPETLAALPEELLGSTTVRELMATDFGKDWWRHHGIGMETSFDLAAGSSSRRDWAEYWKNLPDREKAKVQGRGNVPADSTKNKTYPNTLGFSDEEVQRGIKILQRRCREDGTLDRVNARRAAMGLPPWKTS